MLNFDQLNLQLPFLSQTRVGIYISDAGLFVVRAQRKFQKIQVTGSASTLFAESGQGATVSSVLKQTLAKAGVAPNEPAAVCLKGDQTFLKFFELPAVFKAKEMDGVIRFEARKHSPFPINEIECGFQVIKQKPAGNIPGSTTTHKNQVFFSGIKRDILQAWLKPLIDAQIPVDAAEPQAVSLARFLLFWPLPAHQPPKCYLILHKEGGAFNFVVARRGVALVSRFGDLGAEAQTVVAEMQVTLDYFNRTFKGERIEGLLTDLPPADKPLEDLLSKELGLKAESLILSPVLSGKADWSGALLCAAGAALRGLSPGERNLSHLYRSRTAGAVGAAEAPTEDREQARGRFKKLASVQLAGVLLFFAAVYGILAMPVRALEKDLRLLRGRTDAMGIAVGSSPPEISVREKKYLQKISAVEAITRDRIFLTDKLNELIAAIPEGMWLGRVHYRDLGATQRQPMAERRLEIHGWVLSPEGGQDLEIVNSFLRTLSQNKIFMAGFSEIKITTIQREPSAWVPVSKFSLNCRSFAPQKNV